MARYLVAYFKSALNEQEIVESLRAQNWIVTTKSVNTDITDYDTTPYLGFSLTVATKPTVLEINGVAYHTEQNWSFRLGRSTEGDEFDIDYSALTGLLNWVTVSYQSECCLTWDGESVYVLFNKGKEYLIDAESQYWADYIRPIMKNDSIVRFERFDWL